MDCLLQLFVQSEDELGKRQALSRVSLRFHGEDGERWKEVGCLVWEKLCKSRRAIWGAWQVSCRIQFTFPSFSRIFTRRHIRLSLSLLRFSGSTPAAVLIYTQT